MSEKLRSYSILIVSASDKLNTAVHSLLPASSFTQVVTVSDISAAARKCTDRRFDMILINSPLPDDAGIRFAIDRSASGNTVVMLLLKSEIHDEIYENVVVHGVFTLKKPVTLPMLSTAVGWMCSAREKLRTSEKKTLTIEEKMAEIRTVNRAKWLLIENEGMDEPQAHRYIEKTAMDSGMTKRTTAEEIIARYQ